MAAPYRIRADLNVNGGERKLVFACIENETPEHLGLKLAAYLAFWDEELFLDARHNHPSLEGQEFYPDLLGVDAAGTVTHWVECGNTAMHKLGKVVRRWPDAKVYLFKENAVKAEFLRGELKRQLPDHHEKFTVFCWPDRTFRDWMALLSERVAVYGEAGGVAFNLVVNDQIYATDLLKY